MKTYQSVSLFSALFLFVALVLINFQADMNRKVAFLSPEKQVAYEKLPKEFSYLTIGDFVNIKPDGSDFYETFVVTDRDAETFGRIKLEGPGPGSNNKQRRLWIRWDPHHLYELVKDSSVYVISRRNHPGWEQIATWYHLQ
jgi:hypothetical protein